jgi:hypothetical protein
MAKTATATKATETETEVKPERAIVTVKAGALSLDVGPAVISGLDKSYKDEAKANQLLQEVNGKRYDLLSQLTLAIVKAAKADDTIDLSVAFSGEAKRMNVLNDQIGIALGFREVTQMENKKGDVIAKIGYAKAVQKFFPTAKDDKKAPETVRKATMRSNFLHMIKKCAQAAAAVIEKDITIKQDKASGTLQISGPEVVKQFGAETVLLNERQTIGEGEQATKLKEKPSFTTLARIGAEASGKTLQIRKDSRAASNAVDPDTALQSICNTLVQSLNKLTGKPAAKTVESLQSVQSAIAKVLKV